jgi:uncharacterized phage protein (TIGR02220 family)
MEIISLNNHVVRKALGLSLNEMAVLCDIKNMSSNPRTNFMCIKSKAKIAEWLDLSRRVVFTILDTLEGLGYIHRSESGMRPSNFIYDLDSMQDEIVICIKSNDRDGLQDIFDKIKECRKCTTPVQKMHHTGAENAPIILSNINIKKDIRNPEEKKSQLEEKKENPVGPYDLPPAIKEVGLIYREVTGQQREWNKDRVRMVAKLLKEGYTASDFKSVIVSKYNEWNADEKMRKFITPETIFARANFVKYIENVRILESMTRADESKVASPIVFKTPERRHTR